MQRFGGSMNLHVHFHVVALDGAYESADGPDPILERQDAPPRAPAFISSEPPSAAEVAAVVQRIATRVARWERRKGHRLGAPFESSDDVDPAIALVRLGASRGHFATLARDGRTALADDDAEFVPRRASPRAASFEQFNVHADVTVRAGDRDARERLCRYGARPPFSLDRISVLDDGRVAYRVKYPGPRGQTHRVMTPLEFMSRLSALIPPPRVPLVRYSGVLAPNARLRRRVVPRAERSTRARLEIVRRSCAVSTASMRSHAPAAAADSSGSR